MLVRGNQYGKLFGNLSQIVVSRKISVGDVILGAEISRNAFFKYKSGVRLPANREIVERIADALCLNRDEYDSLIEASLIQQADTSSKNEHYIIEHMMAVNESDGSSISDRLCGIENLEKLIQTMSRCANYIPYYYYASLSTLRIMDNIPNNLI